MVTKTIYNGYCRLLDKYPKLIVPKTIAIRLLLADFIFFIYYNVVVLRSL
jgi:hypothetical protein